MKGAFSRLTRAGGPERFTNVLLQQGRVLLDADWNDLAEIIERELRERTRMIIGSAGGPEHEAGFELIPRCGIRLNCGGDADKQYGQWIVVEGRTLPFAGAYTIALEFRLPAQCCATGSRPLLIDVDGRWRVVVKGDNLPPHVVTRRVCLELVIGDQTIPLGQVDAERSMLLVGRHEPKLGLEIWLYPAEQAPSESAAGPTLLREWPRREQSVWIAGGPDDREELCCTIEGLWIWATRTDRPPRPQQGRLVLHDCELRCDLDMSAVEPSSDERRPGAKILDRSKHHNDGWIRTVNDHEQLPPVLLLEVFAEPGAYFVEGVLAHSGETTAVALPRARDGGQLWVQYYLEVRQRFITALQDQQLLEPALNGPDTTARTETVWRVGVLEVASEEQLRARWDELERRLEQRPQARFDRREDGSFDAGNRLYRVEIHHPGWAWTAKLSDAHASKASVESKRVTVVDPDIAALLQFDSPVALWSGSASAPTIARVVCEREGGFEFDQLPAELANLRLLPLATFKWSRDNGCIAFPVEAIVEASTSTQAKQVDEPRWTITLAGPGYNGLDLEVGQWLELVDDATDLDGRGGWFFRIVSVDFSAALQLTAVHVGAGELPLAPAQPGEPREVALREHPIVRRWDIGLDQTPDHGLPLPLRIVQAGADKALLEQGIEVEFSKAGFFAREDWWVAAVRDAVEQGLLKPAESWRPPQGVARSFAKLAVLELGLGLARWRDQRQLFAPLTKLAAPSSSSRPDQPSEPIESMQAWIASAQILVEEDQPHDGLIPTGERVITRIDIESAKWSFVAHEGDPRGPGEALSWAGRSVFLAKQAAYEQRDGSWSKLPSFPDPLLASTDFAATSFGALLWVLGTGAASADPVLYWLHSSAASWESVALQAHPNLAAASARIASLGATIHVVGGRLPTVSSKDSGYLASHLEIDPRSGAVTVHSDLAQARADFALVAHQGQLYAIAGCNQAGNLASVERWHPEVDRWIELDAATPPPGMSLIAATSIDEGIVVTGGQADGVAGRTAQAWLFDPGPSGARWRKLADMTTPRFKHGLVAVGRELRAIAGDGSPGSDRLLLSRSLQVMRIEPRS